jgi:hypothetical protein
MRLFTSCWYGRQPNHNIARMYGINSSERERSAAAAQARPPFAHMREGRVASGWGSAH